MDMCMLLVFCVHCIHTAEQHPICRQTVLLCLTEQRTQSIWLSCTTIIITYNYTSLEGLCICMRCFLCVLVEKRKKKERHDSVQSSWLNLETHDIRNNLNLMSLMRNLHAISCQHWCFKIMQQDRDL